MPRHYEKYACCVQWGSAWSSLWLVIVLLLCIAVYLLLHIIIMCRILYAQMRLVIFLEMWKIIKQMERLRCGCHNAAHELLILINFLFSYYYFLLSYRYYVFPEDIIPIEFSRWFWILANFNWNKKCSFPFSFLPLYQLTENKLFYLWRQICLFFRCFMIALHSFCFNLAAKMMP